MRAGGTLRGPCPAQSVGAQAAASQISFRLLIFCREEKTSTLTGKQAAAGFRVSGLVRLRRRHCSALRSLPARYNAKYNI